MGPHPTNAQLRSAARSDRPEDSSAKASRRAIPANGLNAIRRDDD
jgi:hypothetical protein